MLAPRARGPWFDPRWNSNIFFVMILCRLSYLYNLKDKQAKQKPGHLRTKPFPLSFCLCYFRLCTKRIRFLHRFVFTIIALQLSKIVTALVACCLATFRATLLFVLMHSGIVNGYQVLCDAHTCLNHIGELQLYFYFNHYRPFQLFLLCVGHSDSPFLGCLFSLC